VLLRRVRRSVEEHGTDAAEGAALVEALIARFEPAACSMIAAMRRRRREPAPRGTSRAPSRAASPSTGVTGEVIAAAMATSRTPSANADLAAACTLARPPPARPVPP